MTDKCASTCQARKLLGGFDVADASSEAVPSQAGQQDSNSISRGVLAVIIICGLLFLGLLIMALCARIWQLKLRYRAQSEAQLKVIYPEQDQPLPDPKVAQPAIRV